MTHVVSDIGERKPASSEIPPRADHIAAATQHRRHWARRTADWPTQGRTVRERATGNAEQSPSFAISWRRSLEFAITCR